MKLNINSILLLLIFSMLFFTSCTPIYYATNAGHSLGLDEEGDVKFSGALLYDTQSQSSGLSAKLGYSPIKNIGIQTNYSSLGLNGLEQGYMFNNAVGYYYFLERDDEKTEAQQLTTKQEHTNGTLFEAYTGFAFGNANNKYNDGLFRPIADIGNIKTYLNQYYLQVGIHIYERSMFKLTFSHRLSLLNLRKAIISGELGSTDEKKSLIYDLEKIKVNNPFIFNEFNCKLNIGIPKVNFYFMASFGSSNKPFPYSSTTMQLGMALDINDIVSKKIEKKKPYSKSEF